MNSRNKGAVGERELAGVLVEFGWSARRGQQFAGGPESPDVVGGPPGYHIEVKRVEALNVWAAFAQAARDCGDRVPMVAMRRNRSPWLAVVDLRHLLGLLRALEARGGPSPQEAEVQQALREMLGP